MPQNPYLDALTALQQMNAGQTQPLPGAQPDYAHPIDSLQYRQAIAPIQPTDRMKAISQGFVGTDQLTPEQQAATMGRVQDLQKILAAPGGVDVERMKMDQQRQEAQMLMDAAQNPNTPPMTRIGFPGGGSFQTASPAQLDPSGAISKGIETEVGQYNTLSQNPSPWDILKNFVSGVPGAPQSWNTQQHLQNLFNNIQAQSKSIGRHAPVAPPPSSARPMNPAQPTDPRRQEVIQILQANKYPVTEANIQHLLSQQGP